MAMMVKVLKIYLKFPVADMNKSSREFIASLGHNLD
jgi:hypothetical protein